ncbi:hypothetical protein AVEN_142153-1 [Araneus ventricosus]|uniref:Uncharacterized protein n=1 Tax=Araneus ventricosus TaxID=182803 RepID=A0A4Y2U159_ARAVE|nr:hypothetical protein AVEN_142153-1 [Araneus ventricosus]
MGRSRIDRDARMPTCKGELDKCQCHPSYTGYEDDTNKQQKNCLKVSSEKKNWDLATTSCANEFSVLMDYGIPDLMLEDFRNKS